MISTLAGIKILFNPFSENAHLPIRCNLDPVSNVIDSRDVQAEKHSSPMISTLAGIKILFNPLSENALDRICCNLDPVSNVIDSSDLQAEKH
jgi:hypothetical protein